jgi:hypothetical protein
VTGDLRRLPLGTRPAAGQLQRRDRGPLPAQAVLIVSSLASAVLMAGMAVVVGLGAPVGLVLAISALSSAALAHYRSAAGALTPEIVSERDLAAANSIFSALESLVVVIGPGIGVLLLLTGRPVIGVAINAASFVIAAAVIARLRVRSAGGGAVDGSALQQWAAGSKRWPRSPSRWRSPCSAPSTPLSTVPAPSSTSRCRSGWAPVSTATAAC